jgi:hypothetical protein
MLPVTLSCRCYGSEFDVQAVVGEFHFDLSPTRQDIGTHMVEYKPFAGEPVSVLLQAEIVHMERDSGLERAALADKEVGARGERGERFGPSRVPRIRNCPPIDLDSKSEAQVVIQVWQLIRRYREVTETVLDFRSHFDVPDLIGDRGRGSVRIKRSVELRNARFDAWRASDRHGPVPVRGIKIIQQKVRNTSKVIAVKMAHQDGVDSQGIDFFLPKAGQGGGAAVDQHRFGGALHQNCGLVKSAGTEGIAGTEEGNSDRFHEREYTGEGSCGPEEQVWFVLEFRFHDGNCGGGLGAARSINTE